MRGVAYDPVFRAKLMAMHQQGVSMTALSHEFGIARQVLSRWWHRYAVDDLAGLMPQSRRPHVVADGHLGGDRAARLALAGAAPKCGAHRPPAGPGAQHRSAHSSRRMASTTCPRPARPKPRRYEKQRPGELIHIDLKYLPALRNARNDFEFAAVDDFSREAVVWITTEQTSAAATTFLERVAATLPYPIEAVLTDNAFAFTMRHALPCRPPDPLSAGLSEPRHCASSCSGRMRRSLTVKSSDSSAPSMMNVSMSDRSSPLRPAAAPWTISSGITTINDRISVSAA